MSGTDSEVGLVAPPAPSWEMDKKGQAGSTRGSKNVILGNKKLDRRVNSTSEDGEKMSWHFQNSHNRTRWSVNVNGVERGIRYNTSLDDGERMAKIPHTPPTHPMVTTLLVSQQYFYLLCQLWTSHSFIPIKECCRIVKMDLGRNDVSSAVGMGENPFISPESSHELPSCQWAVS